MDELSHGAALAGWAVLGVPLLEVDFAAPGILTVARAVTVAATDHGLDALRLRRGTLLGGRLDGRVAALGRVPRDP